MQRESGTTSAIGNKCSYSCARSCYVMFDIWHIGLCSCPLFCSGRLLVPNLWSWLDSSWLLLWKQCSINCHKAVRLQWVRSNLQAMSSLASVLCPTCVMLCCSAPPTFYTQHITCPPQQHVTAKLRLPGRHAIFRHYRRSTCGQLHGCASQWRALAVMHIWNFPAGCGSPSNLKLHFPDIGACPKWMLIPAAMVPPWK